ncbi:MAG TPA: hypothetical protein VKX96_03165 [Chloroflexota bacterium]|nr:hypothetical protein [Chloroflexota bacterium]
MTTTSSGIAAASGVQDQTSLANVQTSVIVTGGGEGAAVVQNSNSAAINDRGAAIAQSGLSNVQDVAVTGGTSTFSNGSSAMPRANSGSAFAIGLIAQNNLTNIARAAVLVNGSNHADISVQSTNGVAITNSAGARAVSGAALSTVAKGQTLQASAVVNANPRLAITPPLARQPGIVRSNNLSSTGLSVSNVSRGALSSTVNGPTGPVSITQYGNATITNSGQATSISTDACIGNSCPPANGSGEGAAGQTPTKGLPSIVHASSGSASAVGLQAQNSVNTSANVNVHIGGSNFGIIHVIVQTISALINWGDAETQSGIAAATSGTPMTSSQSASPGSNVVPGSALAISGDVGATGATVTNQVNLSSSASVLVNGNNFNPIQVLVQLVVNIANRGIGSALSGSARATSYPAIPGDTGRPSGAALTAPIGLTTSATSGSAQAIGLQAQNQIDLSSDVSIDVTGSNYAPIDVYVVLGTQLANTGQASASTGQALASSSALSPASASNNGGTAADSASPGSTIGTMTTAPLPSDTLSGRAFNGPLTRSRTGNAQTSSVETTVYATNQQGSVASTPGSLKRTATNTADYLVQTRGQTSVVSGGASTGPIPIPPQISAQGSAPKPIPSGVAVLPSRASPQGSGIIILHRVPAPSTDNGGSGGPESTIGSLGSSTNGQPQAGSGNLLTDVTLWSTLPDPGLPLMPRPRLPTYRGQPVSRQNGQTATEMDTLAIIGEPSEAPMPGARLVTRTTPPDQVISRSDVAESLPGQATAPVVTTVRPEPLAVPASSRDKPTTTFIVAGILLAMALAAIRFGWRRRLWLVALVKSSLFLIHLP